MSLFITGTNTDIGKTLVSTWLCLHSKYSYFKPIQTGSIDGTDSEYVANISGVKTHKESYIFKEPVSPHLAAKYEHIEIDIDRIKLPQKSKLIIEGAGGVLVPINNQYYIIDLIQKWNMPTILVTKSYLGTINHTLLSIEALKARNINLLGIILNGESDIENEKAIEYLAILKS